MPICMIAQTMPTATGAWHALRANAKMTERIVPPANHGARLPNGVRVWSDSGRKKIVAMNEHRMPTPSTHANPMAPPTGPLSASSSCGTSVMLSAASASARKNAVHAKPIFMRRIWVFVGRSPLASTIGSRLSRTADSRSGTGSSAPPPGAVTPLAAACTSGWSAAAGGVFSFWRTARRATAALSSSVSDPHHRRAR